jgi:hypothetical protein
LLVCLRPLPSWSQGPAKRAIVELVARITKKGGPEFVPPAERIAAFDNDGTLWAEQPLYVQVVFAMDRVKALAPQHPEWIDTQPFKAALEGDLATLAEAGASGWYEIMLATQAGTTTGEFESAVRQWLATARHPRFNRPYTDLVYQPMLEVIAYLRVNGFKTFIVSGGDIDFMRPRVEKAYGVPPEQVVGSSVRIRFELRDGKPVLAWLPTIDLIDDGPGKPVGISKYIGRRPVVAFGNSDGDFEMLEWTTAGSGARLGLYVHHDDAKREWAYDRDSPVGRLARGLDAAPKRGWIIISMKNDWKRVFPFEKP